MPPEVAKLEATELPIRWITPPVPASVWTRRIVPTLCVAMLVVASVQGRWLSILMFGTVLLQCWEGRHGPREGERTYELTYAAAYAPWKAVGERTIGWERVENVEISEGEIRLYRKLRWRSVVLSLPPDRATRELIVAAVRAKTRRAKRLVTP